MDEALTPQLIFILFMGLVLIAAVSMMQFYRGRKKNLRILEESIKILEDVFKPRDKNYTVIGIYIGYSASFKIDNPIIKNVEAVILLFPRQSLLYAPIAKITSRFDRAYIIVNYNKAKKFPGEAHVIARGFYRLGIKHTIRNIEKMRIERIKIGSKDYYLVYNNRGLAEKLLNYLKNLENPLQVKHIAIVPRVNRLYMALKLDMETFKDTIKKYYELASKI